MNQTLVWTVECEHPFNTSFFMFLHNTVLPSILTCKFTHYHKELPTEWKRQLVPIVPPPPSLSLSLSLTLSFSLSVPSPQHTKQTTSIGLYRLSKINTAACTGNIYHSKAPSISRETAFFWTLYKTTFCYQYHTTMHKRVKPVQPTRLNGSPIKIKKWSNDLVVHNEKHCMFTTSHISSVSYTHLTLPTILRV